MPKYDEIRFKGTDEEIREQWLAARREGIGGSDAAAIIGLSKYATPYTVWLEKTGRMIPEDISTKEAVYWGNVLEDVVAKEYAKRHPEQTVRRKNAMLRHKERPWMQASLDRVVTDEDGKRGVLEIKTAGAFRAEDWETGIPEYYVPQCIHYLAVTGFEFFVIACLIGGQKYVEYRYERDEEDVAYINRAERDFWLDHVVADVPPATTGADADAVALMAQHPAPEDDWLHVLEMDLPELQRYEELGAEIKRLTEKRKEAANALKARIGDKKGIMAGGKKIAWVRTTYQSFDSKKFKAEYPHLHETYCTEKPKDGGLKITERK